MPQVDANGIRIEYDTFGSPSDRPLLLVMGLGGQMPMWDDAFCSGLAAEGQHVIRFDNRDVGLSTWFDEAGAPNIIELMQKAASGESFEVPYTLDDMADDTAGLIAALGLEDVHVCGASMGGMIVQTLAIRHPGRVRSLVSIMSTTGNAEVPPAKPEAMARLMTPPAAGRDGAIEASVETWKVIGSPGFPPDEDRVRERAGILYDRAFHPEGTVRQMAAIMAHGSRVEALRGVTAPTLVIHGEADPLVPVEGGRDTAASVPGAELLLIPGMGHDMPVGVWPQLTSAISEHTEKAERG